MAVYSAECLHYLHGSCTYEDCACRCHLLEQFDGPELGPDQSVEEFCDLYQEFS